MTPLRTLIRWLGRFKPKPRPAPIIQLPARMASSEERRKHLYDPKQLRSKS